MSGSTYADPGLLRPPVFKSWTLKYAAPAVSASQAL